MQSVSCKPARSDPSRSCCAGLASIGSFDGPRHFHPRGHVEFAEQVAQMRFDGFDAEEQLGGDLGVGLAGDDKPRDLQLTLGERLEAAAIWYAGPRAPVDVMALLSQFALRLVALAHGAAGGEAGGG